MSGAVNPKLSGIYSSKNNTPFSQSIKPNTNTGAQSGCSLPSDFPTNNREYVEEINKRTFTSRTFKEEHGGIVIQYGSKNLNYLDKENKFQPIKATLSGTSSGWSAAQQQFPTLLYKDGSTAIEVDEKNE